MARDRYEQQTNHAVSVTGTATKLTTALPYHERNAVLIQNMGVDIVYIGGAGVASTTGIRLAANESQFIEGPVDYYGISVGTSDVRVTEFR